VSELDDAVSFGGTLAADLERSINGPNRPTRNSRNSTPASGSAVLTRRTGAALPTGQKKDAINDKPYASPGKMRVVAVRKNSRGVMKKPV
jgi:hypothetical protein